MFVHVYNRKQIAELAPSIDTVVISIGCPSESAAPLRDGWADVLRLSFHDINLQAIDRDDWLNMETDRYTLFDSDHAKDILSFIGRNFDKNVVVHCAAGVSRSVAVGCFLRDALGYEIKLFAIKTEQLMNGHVYSTLKREYSIQQHGVAYMPPNEWIE